MRGFASLLKLCQLVSPLRRRLLCSKTFVQALPLHLHIQFCFALLRELPKDRQAILPQDRFPKPH